MEASLIEQALKAAKNADWQQVVQNGGEPCFQIEGERFCLRAKRWSGHVPGEWPCHEFVSLDALIAALAAQTHAPLEQPRGSYNCPVCGWNEPHHEHADDAISRLMNENISLRQAWKDLAGVAAEIKAHEKAGHPERMPSRAVLASWRARIELKIDLLPIVAQTHAPEGIDGKKEHGADPWIGPLQQRRREIMAIPHGMACGGACSTCEELRRIDVALKTIADYQPLDGESAALLIEREKTTDQPKGSDEHEVGRR